MTSARDDARTRVTVVTVSYNSAAVLAGLLESIPPRVAVVVVDNGGSDDTAAVAARHGAALRRLDRNHGFGRGCNAGAAVSGSEFLFFVNPDARLDPGCVDALVAFMDGHPDAAAANPRIVKPNGRTEFKRRSILVPRAEWLAQGAPDKDAPIIVLLGGAIFVRRSAFEAVGGFDPAIFLYHEDDDLSVRLRRQCGPVWFVPDARVDHMAGHWSGRSPAVAAFKGYHMARSRIYALTKHGGRLAWLRTSTNALSGLILPHNLLSARRRAKHLGQLRGAWSAWRDGGAYGAPLPPVGPLKL
jgi:N-acetylglucosaminyl-diphospho-decaprenol L-rhamnosyltransferase